MVQAGIVAHFLHCKAREEFEMEAAMPPDAKKKKKAQPVTADEHLRMISSRIVTGQPAAIQVVGKNGPVNLPK
jgi:hypothetical protein